MIVKPSIAFEDMRKSAGGVTASKNRSRLYIKNRITPRNPRTDAQTEVRARLATNSKNWAALTQAQRNAWDEFATTAVGVRMLGSAAKISGFNCYVRVSNNLDLIGQTPISEPPIMPEFTPFEITGVTYTAAAGETAGTLNVLFNGISSLNAQTMVIEATAGFSQGRASFTSKLRYIGHYSEITGGGINVLSDYVTKFGNFPDAGNKVQFRAYIIDNATGIASLKQSFVLLIENSTASAKKAKKPTRKQIYDSVSYVRYSFFYIAHFCIL